MKVVFPTPASETIEYGSVNLHKGILITNNPHGVIMEDCDRYWQFYACGDMEMPLYGDEDREVLLDWLKAHYPDIEMNYYADETVKK